MSMTRKVKKNLLQPAKFKNNRKSISKEILVLYNMKQKVISFDYDQLIPCTVVVKKKMIKILGDLKSVAIRLRSRHDQL